MILLSVLLVVAGGYIGGANRYEDRAGLRRRNERRVVFFSDKIALKSSGAQPVTREQLPRLYAVMERLAAKGNMPGAEALCDSARQRRTRLRPGAIRGMRRWRLPKVCWNLMNDDELEGVIAHELSHVRNYDILTTSVAATIAGAITYLAHMAHGE